MDFQLVVVRGRGAASTIKLGDGVTTVGRQDECQLRIKSSQVSRKHCELFEKKGLLLVKDLGSSNGTYVNGKRITEQRVLEPGDELMIGQVTLKVAKAGAPAPTPAQAVAPAPKPGDTAVVAATAGAAATGEAATSAARADDDFDIEFDEDMGFGEPTTAPAEPTAPLSAEKAAVKPASQPTPAPAPPADVNVADEAVADFLLDIKFDEEE